MSSVLPLSTASDGRVGAPHRAPRAARIPLAHRTDIEGLRGIAVLSVLAVHSFPAWLQGGFIGVDIFFVLSGYLISQQLLQSLEDGRYSLIDFYARRVRRLYPALCLVLLACLVFSVACTFPSASRQVGQHVAAGALFISNLVLWSEAGYFDAASQAKPLLHLWSLGIEEQFYLVWPLVMAGLFRHRRWAPWLIVAALLLSLGLNLALVHDRPVATFFLPPTRFWELMVGALLAWLTWSADDTPASWLRSRLPGGPWSHQQAADALAWLGLAMLALALWLIDKSDPFPGWRALLPTLGTFALLSAGPEAWVNRQLLSQPILRFYGAISYPLYLWHWPLLSFPVVLGLPLSSELRVLILVASVVLATLTHELLEKPVRRGLGGARLTWALFAALAVLGAAGWAVKRTDGLLATYPPQVREIAAAEFDADFPSYRIDRCFLRMEQGPEAFSDDCIDRSRPSRPLMFLWGDSHAAALYPGLQDESAHAPESSGFRLAQFTAAACPPLMSAPPHSAGPCDRTNRAVLERIAAERPATVVLAGHWSKYGTDAGSLRSVAVTLRQTAAHLKAMGVEKVVVFGNLPTWQIPQPRMLLGLWNRLHAIPEYANDHLDPASIAANQAIQRAMADTGVVFISPIEALCNASGCLTSTQHDGVLHPTAFDASHLTPEGSRVLVERSRSTLFP
ncbi:MAG: acyltransferase [Burkholderiaceae bacterium]|nr:acyltransferase [Burkholderiaceae bacterium]